MLLWLWFRRFKRISVDHHAPTTQDNTEPDISGGYILKIDKLRAGEEAFFFDLPSSTRIIGYYPDVDDITEPQKVFDVSFSGFFFCVCFCVFIYVCVSV